MQVLCSIVALQIEVLKIDLILHILFISNHLFVFSLLVGLLLLNLDFVTVGHAITNIIVFFLIKIYFKLIIL